jgi:hypothetical protein
MNRCARHLGEAWGVKLRYTPRAATELDKVLSDIELESRGLFALRRRVRSIINLILQYPHAAPLRSKRGIRCIAVYSYPYLIFPPARGLLTLALAARSLAGPADAVLCGL